jgi:tripeptide aminopeptidase
VRSTDGAPPEPDRRRAFDLVMRLLAIPGRSTREREVAEFIKTQLLEAGAPARAIESDAVHRRTPARGDTGNLVLRLPGTRRGGRRMLSAHIDTVPLCVGCRPVRRGGVVRSVAPGTALGADDRAGAAVVLNTALEILLRHLPHPPLTFCWFVQEELGLQGSRQVRTTMLGKPGMAFNWDGGSPYKLTVGATGCDRLSLDIEGLASHAGGAPELGVSAIAIAALAIADLHRTGWHGDIRKGRRRGTSNFGHIRGGEATNVVTDRVRILAEARSHDPRFRRRMVQEIERAFRGAAREVRSARGARGKVTMDVLPAYESYRLAENSPCVLAAEAAVRSLGHEAPRAVANGGIDANWMVRHGIPTVSLGCGQRNAHTVHEELEMELFHEACRIALRLATATESQAVAGAPRADEPVRRRAGA